MRISDWSSDVCSSDLLAAGTIQSGIIVTTEQIRPKLSNIGFKRGFKKMFSSLALADFAKCILKLIVVGTVVSLILWPDRRTVIRSEEHTSELQSLMRTSYAVFCFEQKIPDTLCATNYGP